MHLPADHPQRRVLAEEVHARPPAPVMAPAVVTFVALLDADSGAVLAALRQLAEARGVDLRAARVDHVLLELDRLTIKWERHGEFATLTFVHAVDDAAALPAAAFPTVVDRLPSGWLARLPGRTIAAADVAVLPLHGDAPDIAEVARWFDADAMAGSRVLDQRGWVFTDFVVQRDGRTRWLVLDAGLGRAQTARLVQRLLEIEVYRMMALLAFPLARAAFPVLNSIEQRIATIAACTADLHDANHDRSSVQTEERRQLDELTRVAAEVERLLSAGAFRFAAAQAYWQIVRTRVGELREQRIGELRTLAGFLGRRLAPAMDSCAAVARRQDELSARISRASALLRTRVDVAREEQSQQLLAAMDRRGRISLRLQQTVEGLSVAAITYYAAGLVGYLAKPLRSVWPQLNVDWVVAASIPVIALLVWHGVERIRRELGHEAPAP